MMSPLETGMTSPVVTVAICTWNRSALLRQTLDQFERLVQPVGVSWRLLIVDNNSTDHTRAVIDEFAGRLPIRYVLERTQGHSHARNRVLDEVADGYVLFTDDDVLVDPGWLASFVIAIREHPEASIFGGPIDPWFISAPDPALVSAFPALARGFCGIDESIFRTSGGVPFGANMGFRRAALAHHRFRIDLGHSSGFQGGGEEVELIRRLLESGATSVWCAGMRLQHCVEPKRMTLDYLKRLYHDSGRKEVRLGVVRPTPPFLAGMPRWMVRKWVEAALKQGYYTITGRRERAMASLRERIGMAGMMAECRELSRGNRPQRGL
jgi:glycosyltransferase involved in cell wall biosynthesis